MPAYSLRSTTLELSRRSELSTESKLRPGTRSARRRLEAELETSEQRRNLPLPHELMGMIFNFYVYLYGQIPERLLLVCRAWHVLALSQPALWTNLDPLGPFGLRTVRPWAGTFLQSRILRSNPAPLKVDFSRWSHNTQPKDVKRIADIRTFRPRIQDLVISSQQELQYLIGSQPLLTRLRIGGGVYALGTLYNNPTKYMLSEKTITTLRFTSPLFSHVWPESLVRRLQTLEVNLNGFDGGDQLCWSMVQKAVALLTLHVNISFPSAPLISHPSCRNLIIVYNDTLCSVEEVRMPRLQGLTIVACDHHVFMRLTLVDTPVSSLRLTCKARQLEDLDPAERASWVGGAIHLLRSTPRLERLEICAPGWIVVSISEAIAEDSNLCMELHTFTFRIDLTPGIWQEARGHVKDDEADFAQLRNKIFALMSQRRLCQSKN